MSREGEGRVGKSRDLEVAAYAVNIPPFWPSNHTLWFTQIEYQLILKGITAQFTKFHHVLANISQMIATEVRDLLVNSPAKNPYENLGKSRLIGS